jgi:hypothetical protein
VGFRYSARKTGGDCRPFISSVEANAAGMPVSYEHLKMLIDDGRRVRTALYKAANVILTRPVKVRR